MSNLDLAKTVIDHRKSNNPDARSVYELQLEMDTQNASKFKWVPFTDFYKQYPLAAQEYFKAKKVSLESVLSEEVKNREKNVKCRSKNNKYNFEGNQFVVRDFTDVAKRTIAVYDKY